MESNRTPSGWHSGPTSSKSFNSVTSSGSRDPRNEASSWSSRSSDSVNRYVISIVQAYGVTLTFVQLQNCSLGVARCDKLTPNNCSLTEKSLVADGATRAAWEIHCGIRFRRHIRADRCSPWDWPRRARHRPTSDLTHTNRPCL